MNALCREYAKGRRDIVFGMAFRCFVVETKMGSITVDKLTAHQMFSECDAKDQAEIKKARELLRDRGYWFSRWWPQLLARGLKKHHSSIRSWGLEYHPGCQSGLLREVMGWGVSNGLVPLDVGVKERYYPATTEAMAMLGMTIPAFRQKRKSRFYVYVITCEGTPIYVGKGSGDRCMKHMERPDFACFNALTINVTYCGSEQEAFDLEAARINLLWDGGTLLNRVRPVSRRPTTLPIQGL